MLIDQESEGGNASGVIKPQSMLVSPSGVARTSSWRRCTNIFPTGKTGYLSRNAEKALLITEKVRNILEDDRRSHP